MRFKDERPELELDDPLDRYVGRELAKAVLRRTSLDDPEAAFRVAFADELLTRCKARETGGMA